jgi:hypothetical protein
MSAVGFRPLEPFKNIASPWLSLCERCTKTSTPRLNNVRTRGECCRHCARYGLDPGAPARLYVLSHAEYGAVKIGITGLRTREDRVVRFRGHGWAPFAQIQFATGADAYRVEQRVIKLLRAEGHPVFLSDAQMPIGGYKETFDAARVSVGRLLVLAEGVVRGGVVRPRSAGPR